AALRVRLSESDGTGSVSEPLVVQGRWTGVLRRCWRVRWAAGKQYIFLREAAWMVWSGVRTQPSGIRSAASHSIVRGNTRLRLQSRWRSQLPRTFRERAKPSNEGASAARQFLISGPRPRSRRRDAERQ